VKGGKRERLVRVLRANVNKTRESSMLMSYCDYCTSTSLMYAAVAHGRRWGQSCAVHPAALLKDALKADPAARLEKK
jgi:hypothetical protein